MIEDSAPTSERGDHYVNQGLSIAALRERFSRGENIFELIRSRLMVDTAIMEQYWEASFNKDSPLQLPKEIWSIYEITPEDLQIQHHDDESALHFWSGISYVGGHILLDLVAALASDNQLDPEITNPTIQKLLQSHPEAFTDEIKLNLELDSIEARLRRERVKQSLQQDPSGVSWIRKRIIEVDQADPENPLFARERSGMEAVIKGVGNLYSKITVKSSDK